MMFPSFNNQPNRMIEHHADEQDKQMMDAEETIVEVSSHLSGGECPDYKQTSKHCPSWEANWCQKNETKHILYWAEEKKEKEKKVQGNDKLFIDWSNSRNDDFQFTSSLSRAQLISSSFASYPTMKKWALTTCVTEWMTRFERDRMWKCNKSIFGYLDSLSRSQKVSFFIITRCEN